MKGILSRAKITVLAVVVALVLVAATPALAKKAPAVLNSVADQAVTAVTGLKGSLTGAILKLDNDGSGTALQLEVQPGQDPLAVNSDGKVDNLNADKVDGKDANQLVRVSSFTGPSPLLNGTNGTVATTTINAPASGFLVIDAGSDIYNFQVESDTVSCRIEVDNALASGSTRSMEINQGVNTEEDCSTNTVVPVSAGTHTVDLEATDLNSPNTGWGDTALSVIYIPFDGSGVQPAAADISAAQQEEAPEPRK